MEVLDRLDRQIEAQKPLLMFGAGIGLTAKCAELGGADLIAVYSTAIYRMMGQHTLMAFLPYSNANEHVAKMAGEILPAVKETPCIVGVGAHDPRLNQEMFLDEMMALGFSGVTNEPFAGIYGPEFAAQLESAGLGFSREAEMIALAHSKGIFTYGWAFTPQEARKMAEAGADVVGALVGVTAGGVEWFQGFIDFGKSHHSGSSDVPGGQRGESRRYHFYPRRAIQRSGNGRIFHFAFRRGWLRCRVQRRTTANRKCDH